MSEYIDRKRAISEAKYEFGNAGAKAISRVPCSDVVPVIHGHWIISSDGYYPYCSECKDKPHSGKLTKYCPNCGAKMK